jgi:anti-sigma factor RsiW
MNDPLYHQLRESNWRRKLTPSEEAELRVWLAAHPDMESDWESEAGLSEALARLPDAPVPANFTARVLQIVERESAGSRRLESKRNWTLHWILPKLALAGIVLGLGVFSYEHHEVAQRTDLARKVAVFSGVAAASSPEMLQDFETIRSLGQTPPADEELLALLK